jgi:hypothetical protein
MHCTCLILPTKDWTTDLTRDRPGICTERTGNDLSALLIPLKTFPAISLGTRLGISLSSSLSSSLNARLSIGFGIGLTILLGARLGIGSNTR